MPAKPKPGPKPDRLKIEADPKDALQKLLTPVPDPPKPKHKKKPEGK